MLPRTERLTRRRDFSAVYARKKSWSNALLALYVKRAASNVAEAETRRFGFSVSKKVGKAHVRNCVKRRLREICRIAGSERESREIWRQSFDAIYVARPVAATASYQELERAVRDLARRAGLLTGGVGAIAATAATAPIAHVSEKRSERDTEGTGTAS